MVSKPTAAAVNASISTPVRPSVSAVTSIAMALFAASCSKATATFVSASAWHSGMSSDVRLAAWIAAIRATPRTSPFAADPARIEANVAGCITMRPPARATRLVTSLAATSTICA